MSQEFKLENMDETRNYFFEEIKQNELMSWKAQNVLCNSKFFWTRSCFSWMYYWMHYFNITGCISISAFASLIGTPIGITSSAIKLKIYA